MGLREVAILGYDGSRKSGSKIGYPYYDDEWDLRDNHAVSSTLVVRWGNGQHNARREFPHVVNPASSIDRNVRKASASELLSTAVRTPKLFARTIPAGSKAVVRPLEHCMGAGFKIVAGPTEVPYGCYAREYHPTEHEYRIWFCGGQTLAAKRIKLQSSKSDECRSDWGYSAREVTPNQTKITLKAAEKIGLEIGAADILWDETLDEYVLLELNSCPSLDTPRVLDFFKENITRMFEERKNG